MDFRKTEEQELLLESIDEFFAQGDFDENYIQKCEAEQRPIKEFKLAALRSTRRRSLWSENRSIVTVSPQALGPCFRWTTC